MLPDLEVIDAFINRFLECLYPRQFNKDYDHYYGELFNKCVYACNRYDPNKGMTLNSYLFMCCKHKISYVNKKERDWYSKHSTNFNLSHVSKSQSPLSLAEYNELEEQINRSELSARTKEVVTLYLTRPYATYKELGEYLGTSKQNVEQIVRSAKQYFSRRNIQI